MSSSRTGLLIIRAWLEQTSFRPLRVHIRLTTDVSSGFERSVTVTDAALVRAVVDSWLDDVEAQSNLPVSDEECDVTRASRGGEQDRTDDGPAIHIAEGFHPSKHRS